MNFSSRLTPDERNALLGQAQEGLADLALARLAGREYFTARDEAYLPEQEGAASQAA